MLRILDLFSGIGGFSLGLERTGGFETAAFCEIDPFCRKVLAKHWPDVPIYDDVRTLPDDADRLGRIDIVTGGYPCQPFSHAGQRRGAEDDRHLWPAMLAVIEAVRPNYVLAENVAGHISMGLNEVLSDLEASGYTTGTFVIPACAVDAPHRRDRVWIVGHADADRKSNGAVNGEASELPGPLAHPPRLQPGREGQRPERERAGAGSEPEPVPDADHEHAQGRQTDGGAHSQGHGAVTAERPAGLPDRERTREAGGQSESCVRGMDDGFPRWMDEPGDVPRVAAGIPDRVNRLKALGNAVVPKIPEVIGYAILQAEKEVKP